MKKDQLRPSRLQDYCGQDHIKEQLAAAIASAKERDQPLSHVLLSGPPGLGKTTLALIIAKEMDWKLFDLIGSTVGNPQMLGQRFLGMKPKTLFFIDEIHALRKPVQEVLYPVLEDNRLLYRAGDISAEYPLSPITIIGATTDLGKLAQPFMDRFQLQFELQFYEVDELVDIGLINAGKLNLGNLTEDLLEPIAERSRGTPRYLNNYLKWVRDFKIFEKVTQVDREYVEYVLWKKLRIDNLGLRPLDRAYLRVLKEADAPLGLDSIASRLRQAEVTIENTVEPFLLYMGLSERFRNGRIITPEGTEHLRNLGRRIRR